MKGNVLCVTVILITFYGCAGPYDPFGSRDQIDLLPHHHTTTQIKVSKNSHENSSPIIEFSPHQQIYHQSFPLKLKIYDPWGITEKRKLDIYYNGLKVNEKWVKKAYENASKDSQHELIFNFNHLKLSPHKKHNIHIFYQRDPDGIIYSQTFSPPQCPFDLDGQLYHTAPFSPPDEIFSLIQKYSIDYSINPSLIAGIIAQESAFNPRAVSHAKAIGLTQVTPQAEKQIIKKISDWPRYNKINNLPPRTIRWLIKKKRITKQNEWRLNPHYAIDGGLQYLFYIKKYWSLHKHKNMLDEFGLDPNDIILASYNYGPYSVKKGIRRHGLSWLDQKDYRGAKFYINMIKSYCSSFSRPDLEERSL